MQEKWSSILNRRVDDMSEVKIERWIDMDGADFQRVEMHNRIRKIVAVGVEAGLIKVDNAGYMYQKGHPVYAELDGGFVGLRYSAKATN